MQYFWQTCDQHLDKYGLFVPQQSAVAKYFLLFYILYCTKYKYTAAMWRTLETGVSVRPEP